MTAEKDQEEYHTYLDNDGDDETILTFENVLEGDGDDKDSNNGTIIMDADGNYYFQTSDKMVKVEPIAKDAPLKKVPAAVVTPLKRLKRHATENPIHASVTKTEIDSDINNKFGKSDEEIIAKNVAAETFTSEIDDQAEIYEFDETEQVQDELENEKDTDYEPKVLLKPVKKTTPKESIQYSCMLCPYEANKKFLLSRHMKTHSDDRPYKCSVCERGFKTNASLMNHRNIHLGHKPHACKDCEKAFTTSGELVRHVRYLHTHIKPHKCTECDYCSVEMSKLRRHMRCHTGERPYQCPHCTYASPDTFKLKRHMRIHTGEKPYECDICHARFTQSNSLKHHRLIHSVNDKPVFQCHLCPTTCGRKTDLRLHIKKLHSSDQPIPCKRCGKELPDRYSYKMHVKTHEGEKCYRCTLCPYASISQRHLESHVLIHLDAKPFICEICQTSFRQKQLLARHMKVYHSDNYEPPQPRKKDHKCPHCDKLFAFNGNLIRHMETHDPTSRKAEEVRNLKMGRMKRLQADGTIITMDFKQIPTFSECDDYIYEETEEQQMEDDEMNEEEYEEDFTEDNIQYEYDELEADEAVEEEGVMDKKSFIDVKEERMDTMEIAQQPLKSSIIVKAEKNDTEIMSLEVNDGQGFMIVEVLPDDDEAEEQEQENPQAQDNTNIAKATVTKTNSAKPNETFSTDYFGFEVDDDEEDEETKGAIKLLQLIEED